MALEELRSDFGGLGGFLGQSCQSRNDVKTLLFIVFLITHVFRSFFVIILYRVIAPENVKNRYTLVVILGGEIVVISLGFNYFCEMVVFLQQCLFFNSFDIFRRN